MYVCMHDNCVYVCRYVCMHVCTYIHTYVRTYVHTYVHAYIHRHLFHLCWLGFLLKGASPNLNFWPCGAKEKAPSAQGRGYFWAARRCCGPFWRIFGAAAREARRLRGFFMPKNLKNLTNLIWAPMILVDLEWFLVDIRWILMDISQISWFFLHTYIRM